MSDTAIDLPSALVWAVGDITVHRIDEIPLPPATGPWLLPDATPDLVVEQDWSHPHFADADLGRKQTDHGVDRHRLDRPARPQLARTSAMTAYPRLSRVGRRGPTRAAA